MIRKSIPPLGREIVQLEKRAGVASCVRGTQNFSSTASTSKTEQQVHYTRTSSYPNTNWSFMQNLSKSSETENDSSISESETAEAGSSELALAEGVKEVQPKKKTMAELDEELRLKLEGVSGEGGSAGIEYEGGKAVGLKRGVKENMFRVI